MELLWSLFWLCCPIVLLCKYAVLQVILIGFLFDQENAIIVFNGQIIKGFYWPFFIRSYFGGQEKVSFILGSVLMPLSPPVLETVFQRKLFPHGHGAAVTGFKTLDR